MLTKDDIEQIGKLLAGVEERLTRKIEALDLKVETYHAFNRKAHAEIMDTLTQVNEINYRELIREIQALKKRVEQLEGRHHN